MGTNVPLGEKYSSPQSAWAKESREQSKGNHLIIGYMIRRLLEKLVLSVPEFAIFLLVLFHVVFNIPHLYNVV